MMTTTTTAATTTMRTMPLEITMNAQKNLLAMEVQPINTLNQCQTGANEGNANQWLKI